MLKKLEKAILINRILKLYVPLLKENVSRYCHSIISLIQKTKKICKSHEHLKLFVKTLHIAS